MQYDDDDDDALSRNVGLLQSMNAGMENIHNPATIHSNRNDCPPSIVGTDSNRRGKKHNAKPSQFCASRCCSFH